MDVAYLIGKIRSLREKADGDATSSHRPRSQILPLAPRTRPASASAVVAPHSHNSVTAASERSTPNFKSVSLHKVDEGKASTFNVGSGGKDALASRPAGDRAVKLVNRMLAGNKVGGCSSCVYSACRKQRRWSLKLQSRKPI